MIIKKGDAVLIVQHEDPSHCLDMPCTAEVISVHAGGELEVKGPSKYFGYEVHQLICADEYVYKDRPLEDHTRFVVLPRYDSQKRKLLKLLANGGTIDRKQALNEMHIFNLTARIAELRALGVKINMQWKMDRAGVQHVVYFMTVQGLRQAEKDHFVQKRGGVYVPLAI